MEIRTLKYFLAIAREENMTSAANILHVSQSALSRQMLDLEQHLNKQLFIRTNRKTMLTEDGMLFRQRASEIVSLVERTEMEFQSTDKELYGEIHIGAGETPAMDLIANTIKHINTLYPLIKFHIYSGNANDVIERLERGTLNFGLLFEPVNKEKYDYISVPVKDTMGILMRKDSPYANLDGITPKELKEMPLLTSSRRNYNHTVLSNWLGYDLDDLNYVASYNLLYNASLMVNAGIGNALALDGIINTTGESALKFIPLKPDVKLNMVFVWKKYQIFSKASDLFLNEVKKTFSHCYTQ